MKDVLGIELHDEEDIQTRVFIPGVVLGMAWTSIGGKILVIEASLSSGSGMFIILFRRVCLIGFSCFVFEKQGK